MVQEQERYEWQRRWMRHPEMKRAVRMLAKLRFDEGEEPEGVITRPQHKKKLSDEDAA
jgi:hypothetical protein